MAEDWAKKILGNAPTGLLDNDPQDSNTLYKAVMAQGQAPLKENYPGFAGVSAETDFASPNVRIADKKTGCMISVCLSPMVGLSSKGVEYVSYTCTVAVPELLRISNEELAKTVIIAVRNVIDFPDMYEDTDGEDTFALVFEFNMKQPKLETTLTNCYGLVALISVKIGQTQAMALADNYLKMVTHFTNRLDTGE